MIKNVLVIGLLLVGCGVEEQDERVKIIEVDKPVECKPEVKVVNKEVTKYVTIEKKLKLNRKRILRYSCKKHPNKKRCKKKLNKILDKGGR